MSAALGLDEVGNCFAHADTLLNVARRGKREVAIGSVRLATICRMDERWRDTTEVWERIRWARQQSRFERAKDAAESIGIKPVTYRSYENPTNPRIPPIPEAKRIADKFKVSWVWLLAGQGHPHDINARFGELAEQYAAKVSEEKRADAERAALSVLESYMKSA